MWAKGAEAWNYMNGQAEERKKETEQTIYDFNGNAHVVNSDDFKSSGRGNDQIESEVKQQIKEKNYLGAFNTMYDNYGDMNIVKRSLFKVDEESFIDKSPQGGAAAVTDPKGVDGRDPITFDKREWDKVVTGQNSYGWLTRSVYHELTHVMQYQGLFGMKSNNDWRDEFQSHYMAIMNRDLPCYTAMETNKYVGFAIAYIVNASNGKELTSRYATAIQTLLNQCTPEVKKIFINSIQEISHANVNFH
jgi:hypothetical protein